jgi:hypothetical protein
MQIKLKNNKIIWPDPTRPEPLTPLVSIITLLRWTSHSFVGPLTSKWSKMTERSCQVIWNNYWCFATLLIWLADRNTHCYISKLQFANREEIETGWMRVLRQRSSDALNFFFPNSHKLSSSQFDKRELRICCTVAETED